MTTKLHVSFGKHWELKSHQRGKRAPDDVTQYAFGHLKLKKKSEKSEPDAKSNSPRNGSVRSNESKQKKSALLMPSSARAPIRRLHGDELAKSLKTFSANVESWRPRMTVRSFLGFGPKHADKLRSRLDDTDKTMSHVRAGDNIAIYFVGDDPAGVISMRVCRSGGEHWNDVRALATHPGTSLAGISLMEEAVNVSQDQGAGGTVRLLALTNARKTYEAWGFKYIGNGIMELKPVGNDKWVHQDGRWHYAEFVGQAYVSGYAPKKVESEEPKQPQANVVESPVATSMADWSLHKKFPPIDSTSDFRNGDLVGEIFKAIDSPKQP
jgi:hypothetical protein